MLWRRSKSAAYVSTTLKELLQSMRDLCVSFTVKIMSTVCIISCLHRERDWHLHRRGELNWGDGLYLRFFSNCWVWKTATINQYIAQVTHLLVSLLSSKVSLGVASAIINSSHVTIRPSGGLTSRVATWRPLMSWWTRSASFNYPENDNGCPEPHILFLAFHQFNQTGGCPTPISCFLFSTSLIKLAGVLPPYPVSCFLLV